MAEGERIIGIDLGTTYSAVAVMEGQEAKVVPNQEGNRLTPSVVAFTDKGETLVGEFAKRQAIRNSRRTVNSIKRFMGRRHNEVSGEEKIAPYKIVGGPEEYVEVHRLRLLLTALHIKRAVGPAALPLAAARVSRSTPSSRSIRGA